MTRDEKILSVDNLCKNIANKLNKCNEFDDLLQEARVGVCDCIDDFDESKGLQLSTFVYLYAHGNALKYLTRKRRMIRKPRNETEHKQIIDIEYLENVGECDNYNEIDLSFLKPREQYVIQRYFYDKYSFSDIRKESGFSINYWCKVKKSAIEKLKLKWGVL